MAKLGEIFNLQMGKTPARNNSAYWQNGEHKWVSIADLGNFKKYTEDTKEKITELAVSETGIKAVCNTPFILIKQLQTCHNVFYSLLTNNKSI